MANIVVEQRSGPAEGTEVSPLVRAQVEAVGIEPAGIGEEAANGAGRRAPATGLRQRAGVWARVGSHIGNLYQQLSGPGTTDKVRREREVSIAHDVAVGMGCMPITSTR